MRRRMTWGGGGGVIVIEIKPIRTGEACLDMMKERVAIAFFVELG